MKDIWGFECLSSFQTQFQDKQLTLNKRKETNSWHIYTEAKISEPKSLPGSTNTPLGALHLWSDRWRCANVKYKHSLWEWECNFRSSFKGLSFVASRKNFCCFELSNDQYQDISSPLWLHVCCFLDVPPCDWLLEALELVLLHWRPHSFVTKRSATSCLFGCLSGFFERSSRSPPNTISL